MSLSRADLVKLALGEEEVSKVDFSPPQDVFDRMTETARNDIAGWYYAPEAGLMGRLLTQTECWTEIRKKIANSALNVEIYVYDHPDWHVGHVETAHAWPCLRWHVEQGHMTIVKNDRHNR